MQALDLTGERFGRLTAVEVTRVNGQRGWVCECDCGGETEVLTSQLTSGTTRSCGCLQSPNLKGEKFNLLEVIEEVPEDEREYEGKTNWRCECQCGNERIVPTHYLTTDKVYSCGCEKREVDQTGPRKDPVQVFYNRVYNDYQRNAEKKGRKFDLEKDEFISLINSNCYYCGVGPSNEMDRDSIYEKHFYNGIDRKLNNLGYTTENSVPCCKRCNYKKREDDIEVFLEWIEQIYEYRIRGDGNFPGQENTNPIQDW